MDFGVGYFPTDESTDPTTLARMCEDRGFESLFFTDHTHIPASRATPYPAGTELPREYARTHDPFVALGFAAAATEHLNVGTGICLLVERDPIITAKAVASVDRLSGGRMLFGVGGGWNVEEMENHGTDASRRFGLLRERVEAVREIWTNDEASYHGDQVDFDRIWCWPKPIQENGPPVLLGGNGRGAPRRVLRYADEWMPNCLGDHDKNMARISKLRDAGVEAGRGPIPTTLCLAPNDPALLERYEEAGVHRAVYWLPQGDDAKTEERLDRWAAVMATYS